LFFLLFVSASFSAHANTKYELNKGWQCIRANKTDQTGEEISAMGTKLTGWMPAVVPGTVLTSLLHNKLIPDPFYGMNNKLIPDIYDSGSHYYTYWFVTEFTEKAVAAEHVLLHFRGVNYGCNIYVNGKKFNATELNGMFLRRTLDITRYLAKDGKNRLAVIVYPPEPVGNPNGGQGGDGTIARSITNQYTAGWDWIQPVHDRNTGIWDKVYIERTKAGKLEDIHVVSRVPGKRTNNEQQSPALLQVSTMVMNRGDRVMNGVVQYELQGRVLSQRISVPPHAAEQVELPAASIKTPKLWWPNGYGAQDMTRITMRLLVDGMGLCDEEDVTFGIREINTAWNTKTQSREMYVNGQRIFVKGGNWILSDAMLRFSKERYDAELRYHKDMNLNMVRVWGGGITERPEFYDACDKYGLLVMQDMWMTGDCNGRWHDTYKKDDTSMRRKYPDDHKLWLASCEDQIKMLRNHPSLALWCGGNEFPPPADMLIHLRDSILPRLDGTRYFFEHSNHDSMSLHAHDGPYTIQKDKHFWEHKSYGFNSEVGSVGIGDIESLERFIPASNLVPPLYERIGGKWFADSVWQYHKYSSYDSAVETYGHPLNAADFAKKAQLVNYNQYRALMEGFRSRTWDWYTGVMVWKTQNPWTAMVGQMYDVYLDPNAGMYGLQSGAKSLHVMYDPVWKSVMVANSDPVLSKKVKLRYIISKGSNNIQGINDSDYVIPPDTCIVIARAPDLERRIDTADSTSGGFLVLRLYDAPKSIVDDNTYWFPGKDGTYKWLSSLRPAEMDITATANGKGKIIVSIKNRSDANFSFFNHFSLVDERTKKRILPVFCNNNYISVPPEGKKTVVIEYNEQKGITPMLCVDEWNTGKRYIDVKK
jgi:mannosylglycoprotein endo-beta-mannosidase